jgi:hypothetical protein
MKIQIDDALELAEQFLGKGYKDMGGGRFVSADGSKVVRMGDGDILGLHGTPRASHMNFEIHGPHSTKPGKTEAIVNIHLYLIP